MTLKNKTIRIIYKTLLETFHIGKENYLDMIDLSKVPEKELRGHYVDYRLFSGNGGFGNIFSSIAEGYNASSSDKTEDADTVINSLSGKYYFSRQWQITKVIAQNNVPIIVAIADIEENAQLVCDDLDKAGYFVGFRKVVNIKDMQWQILQFEPMFEVDQTEALKQYDFAYHWTPLYNLQNIIDNGFVPKTENNSFDYPPRIYFLTGAAPKNDILKLGQKLCVANKSPKNTKDYILLKINTAKIPENCKFYFDPNMANAMYTTDSIPSDVIVETKRYRFGD